MRPHPFDPRWTFGWIPQATGGVRSALKAIAQHTGLPVVLVAAVALVLSWRLLRRTLPMAVEVAFAVALLVVATRFGWLKW
jgi:hypothetical protein